MAISLLLLMIYFGLLAAAAIEDVRRLVIPNRLPIAIALLFPAYALASPGTVDVVGSLQIAAAALAVGFGLFAMRVAGGGDVKLFSAATLWAGPQLFPSFLLVTAITGAAIALAMLAVRRFSGFQAPAAADSAAAIGEAAAAPPSPRAELPYGAAIAAGGMAVVLMRLIGV